MSNNKKVNTSLSVKDVTGVRGNIIIGEKLQNEIMQLHEKVGNIEWSGILLYTVDGDIDDPENLVFTAHHVYPMDAGTAGYTEYDFSEDVFDAFDCFPDAEGMKWGHIHTHHNMETFFSGTDTSELADNAPNHNYYLSLIVNHKSKFCAKVAYVVEVEEKVNALSWFFNGKGKKKQKKEKVESVYKYVEAISLDISFEGNTVFQNQIDTIIEDNKPKTVTNTYYGSRNTNSKVNNVYSMGSSWVPGKGWVTPEKKDTEGASTAKATSSNPIAGAQLELDLDKDIEKDSRWNPQGIAKITDESVKEYLVKLMNLDVTKKGTINYHAHQLNLVFNDQNEEEYLANIEDNMDSVFRVQYLCTPGYHELAELGKKIIILLSAPAFINNELCVKIIDLFSLHCHEEIDTILLDAAATDTTIVDSNGVPIEKNDDWEYGYENQCYY